MEKMVAIRDAFGDALLKAGKADERIVVLEADVGSSTKSIVFGKEIPERYYNMGISELGMVSAAAGLASEGFIPFVNTFGVFLTGRAADPIQSMIAYDHLNVKLCGTYVGLSDSYDGASHHAITDVAFMRAIPGMTVITPADGVETERAVEAAVRYNGPVYLRLSRAPAPVIYENDMEFQIGRGIVVREGKDVTIMTTGTLLSRGIMAAELLKQEGIEARVVDMHTVKPLDEALVRRCAGETGAIVTVEEHSIWGGLYSAVAECVVTPGLNAAVRGIGLERFAESGDYEALLNKYGFSPEHIASVCKSMNDHSK